MLGAGWGGSFGPGRRWILGPAGAECLARAGVNGTGCLAWAEAALDRAGLSGSDGGRFDGSKAAG